MKLNQVIEVLNAFGILENQYHIECAFMRCTVENECPGVLGKKIAELDVEDKHVNIYFCNQCQNFSYQILDNDSH